MNDVPTQMMGYCGLLESEFVGQRRKLEPGWVVQAVVGAPQGLLGGCGDGGLYVIRGSEKLDLGFRHERARLGLLRSQDIYWTD